MNELQSVAEFDYRPSRVKTMMLAFLTMSGACLLIHFACTLDRPLNVKGIQLAPQSGRIFFGIVAGISMLGLIPLLMMVYVAFAWDRRVAITPTALILPRPTRMGLSREEIEILLTSIHSLHIVPFIGRTRLLRIHYNDTAIHVPSNMFASERVFDELYQTLQTATDVTHGTAHPA